MTNFVASADSNRSDAPVDMKKYVIEFILFALMGGGVNWVFPSAVAQEIPYLELHQPEGLCISTYMNVTTSAGFISLLIYVYYDKYVKKLSYHTGMQALLYLSSLGCFLTAAVYGITVNSASVLLYLCCFLGGTIGALSGVIMNPFITAYKNDYISATRAGGSFFIFLCALVAIGQGPGTADRFSVSVYLSIFGSLLILSIIAYYIIIHYGIGLKSNESTSEKVAQTELANMNPIYKDTGASLTISEKFVTPNSQSIDELQELIDSIELCTFDNVDRAWRKLIAQCIPEHYLKTHPYLPYALPYMLLVGWVDFHTWGLVSAVAPFSMRGVSEGSGAGLLALAYELGAICLICGDLSTTKFKIPFRYALILFTFCCLMIYIAAFNLSSFHTNAGRGFMVFFFAFGRFLEAHLLTSTYRVVATHFPISYREDAAISIGIMDQVATTAGAVISTILVSTVAKC